VLWNYHCRCIHSAINANAIVFQERKKELEANFVKFGEKIQESVKAGAAKRTASVGADGTVQIDDLTSDVKRTFVEMGPQGGNCTETIQLIKKIPPGDKTVEVLLIEARCHEMMGNYKSALSAAGRLVQKAASHEPWIIDSPRMMAATLGANAAMQLGLSENAISFYQTVLKFDPEQDRARLQYRGLKKVVKLLDKAEKEVRVIALFKRLCQQRWLTIPCFYRRSKRATTRPQPALSMIVSRPCAASTLTRHSFEAKFNSNSAPY